MIYSNQSYRNQINCDINVNRPSPLDNHRRLWTGLLNKLLVEFGIARWQRIQEKKNNCCWLSYKDELFTIGTGRVFSSGFSYTNHLTFTWSSIVLDVRLNNLVNNPRQGSKGRKLLFVELPFMAVVNPYIVIPQSSQFHSAYL